MELKQVTQWLLDNGYAHVVNGESFVLTQKFISELGLSVQQVPVTTIRSKTLSGDPTLEELKEVWTEFKNDCLLPHRVTATDGRQYTILQFSKGVAKRLYKIISDPKIDYNRLVESTKHYYATVAYKALLSNYIDKDIWVHEYENWGKKETTVTDGSNRWESE